eukprot:gene19185-21107_t
MESSFFDDLLKKDVDQNAVNALAGSLESQVASTTNSSNLLVTSSAFSSGNLVKDAANNKVVRTGLNITSTTTTTVATTAPFSSSVVTGSTPVNGSLSTVPLTNSIASSSISNNNDNKSFINVARSSTPTNRLTVSSSSPINASQQQVNIAPKNMVTNAVPIAPRMPTTIMITPQQAQVLMAQGFGAGTTIVPSSILGNVRMTGGGQVPLVPRLTGPNSVAAMTNMMAGGQIQGVQSIVPRLTLTQNQMIASLSNQNQASHPIGIVQTIKQEPNTSSLTITQVPSSNQAQSSTTVMPTTTLTQVKGSSPVPGVVTYRLRQVTPTTALSANTATSSTATAAAAAAAAANNVTIMKESVKKLKEFFQNLISLASGPNQPPDIGRSVKELVQNVMYNKMNEEEFVEKLQRTLKSDPQPNLVPFLKRTLPHLRETMKQQTKVQTTAQSTQQIKIQNQLMKQRVASVSQPAKSQVTPVASATGGAAKVLTAGATGTTSTLQAMQLNNANAKRLTPSQQMMLNRTLAMQQRQQMILKQMSTQGGAAGINVSIGAPTTAGGKDISAVLKSNVAATPATAQALSANAADKSKAKPAFHYSSAMTSNDDDINDVTCMAGVNLMEESANILSTGSELLGSQTRSCKDETFLATDPLKRKIEAIVKKHNLREVQQDVISIVSHAAEERLRNILERMAVLSLHRVEAHKNHPEFEVVSDVKSQLKVFEQIDEVERKHREAREREMLMRVAKSRSRTEDPEQARLKEKAKQLQLEEEELLRKRAANKTALEAIGPRKKRKLDEALASLSTTQNQDHHGGSTDSSSSSQIQVIRDCIRLIDNGDVPRFLSRIFDDHPVISLAVSLVNHAWYRDDTRCINKLGMPLDEASLKTALRLLLNDVWLSVKITYLQIEVWYLVM